MFPELHETFILRELIALQRHGVDFEIFSLQHPRDPITIDEAITLSNDKTHYSNLFSWAVLSTFSLIFMRHPLRCLKAVAKLIWWGRDRPLEVLKNLAILPLSLYFGEKGRSAGITHWHGHWANIPTTTCWYLSQVHHCSWSAAIHGEDIFTANRFLAKKLDDATFAVVCSGYFCNHLQHNIGLERPSSVHLNYHGLDPRVTERAPHQRISTTENGAPMRLLSIYKLLAQALLKQNSNNRLRI